MRILFINLLAVVAVLGTSCEKTDGFTSLTDSPAEIPVTVSNVYDYLPAPTVKASKAENKITITYQMPPGRTIKEVTKIALAGTSSFGAIQNGTMVGRGTNQLWSNTPIPVNTSSYTFTTSFTEAQAKTPTAFANIWPAASNTLLGVDFYFQFKVDNDQLIIPPYVGVFVVD